MENNHIKNIMFDLFDEYEEYGDIKEALRSMNSFGEVSDLEYDTALDNWDNWLAEWENK